MAGVFKSLRYEGDVIALTYQTKGDDPRTKTVRPGVSSVPMAPARCRARHDS